MLFGAALAALPEWRLLDSKEQPCPTCPGGQFFAGHRGDIQGYGGVTPVEKSIPCGQVDHTAGYYLASNPESCVHEQEHHSVYHFDSASPTLTPLKWDGGR